MGHGVQPGTPVDPTKPIQGPYGTGMSGPSFGLCPVGRDWIKESSGNPQTGRDWVRAPPKAPAHLDDTDNVMTHLAYKKISAFSGIGHGFFFWNFRTDVDEPEWSYLLALERGWIPTGNFNDPKIQNSCANEDEMAYKCILKRNAPDDGIKKAVHYVLNPNNATESDEEKSILKLDGKDLRDKAEGLIMAYFDNNKGAGATCDFGGVAMLVEENRTITDDDFVGGDDDEYVRHTIVYRGPAVWQIVLIVAAGLILGTFVGFVVGMRTNKGFNEYVRRSSFFLPINKSKISLVRSALALDDLQYVDISAPEQGGGRWNGEDRPLL